MSILRIHKTKDYTPIHNGFLVNPDLSAKAKGILAFLLTRPDHWNATIHGIVEAMKDGENSIRSGMQELELARYIKRRLERDSATGHIKTVTDVYEIPLAGDEKKGESPDAEKPQDVKPALQETRPPENPQGGSLERNISNDLENTDLVSKEINTPLTPQGGQEDEPLKEKRYKPELELLPMNVDLELWKQWCQHRREIKKPLKPTSVKLQIQSLKNLGELANATIQHSIANGYQGLIRPRDEQLKAYSAALVPQITNSFYESTGYAANPAEAKGIRVGSRVSFDGHESTVIEVYGSLVRVEPIPTVDGETWPVNSISLVAN